MDCYTPSYKLRGRQISLSPSKKNLPPHHFQTEIMTARLKRTRNIQQRSNLCHRVSSQIIKTMTRIHKTQVTRAQVPISES